MDVDGAVLLLALAALRRAVALLHGIPRAKANLDARLLFIVPDVNVREVKTPGLAAAQTGAGREHRDPLLHAVAFVEIDVPSIPRREEPRLLGKVEVPTSLVARVLVAVFGDATYEDMVETLDAWLCKKAPRAKPVEAAAGVLGVLGLPAAEAKRLMASVPVQPNRKVPKQEAPANKAIEIPESKNVQRYALPTKASRFADPWMKKMAQRTAREVCTELAARWADVPAWLKPLRTSIVKGEILGLSTGPAGAFVEIRAKGGHSLRYVPSPTPRAATEKALSALGVSEDDPLRELVNFFDGLRDAPPDHAGVSSLSRK